MVNITERALEWGKGQVGRGHSPGAQNTGIAFRNSGDLGVCQLTPQADPFWRETGPWDRPSFDPCIGILSQGWLLLAVLPQPCTLAPSCSLLRWPSLGSPTVLGSSGLLSFWRTPQRRPGTHFYGLPEVGKVTQNWGKFG